jgi:hypothetical protein
MSFTWNGETAHPGLFSIGSYSVVVTDAYPVVSSNSVNFVVFQAGATGSVTLTIQGLPPTPSPTLPCRAPAASARARWRATRRVQMLSVAVKKEGAILAPLAPRRPQPSRMSLSFLLGDVVQNAPEWSRTRRCWARRSGPLTARTVLRDWSTRERLGEELAKDGAKKWPLRPAPLTQMSRIAVSRRLGSPLDLRL